MLMNLNLNNGWWRAWTFSRFIFIFNWWKQLFFIWLWAKPKVWSKNLTPWSLLNWCSCFRINWISYDRGVFWKRKTSGAFSYQNINASFVRNWLSVFNNHLFFFYFKAWGIQMRIKATHHFVFLTFSSLVCKKWPETQWETRTSRAGQFSKLGCGPILEELVA